MTGTGDLRNPELDAIAGEQLYERSPLWLEISTSFPRFSKLHHPYSDLANYQGTIILMSLVRPKTFKPLQLKTYDTWTALILTQGGTIAFDREYDIGFLDLIKDQTPKNLQNKLSIIPHRVWEERVLNHVRRLVPTLEQAIALPSSQETEKLTGLSYQCLLDLSAFSQAYLLAKTNGLEAVKPHIGALQQGKIVIKA